MDLATFQPSKSLSHWASADPHATALVGPNASFSATELFETVQGLAAGLSNEGIVPRDLVGIDFSGEYALLLAMALFDIGASWVPWSSSSELQHLSIKAVITQTPQVIESSRVIVIDQEWLASLARFTPNPTRPVEWQEEDLCYITFSSGTTGARKAIGINAELMDSRLSDFVPRSEIVFPVFTLFPPLTSIAFHSALVQLVERECIYLPGSAAHNVDVIERFEIRCLRGSPNFLSDVIRSSNSEMRKNWTLESVICGGGRMGATLIDGFHEVPGCEVFISYGATEVGTISSGVLRANSNSVGRVQDEVALEIRSDTGEVLPDGEYGEIFIKKAVQVNSYLTSSGVETGLNAGWFRPGDFGHLQNGELFLAGRTNERINAGGTKIDPLSADQIMQEFPGVSDAACFPIEEAGATANWGVAVVPLPTFNAEVFASFCLEHFGDARPTLVVSVKELPRNAMGKVNRIDLAKLVLTR